VRGGAAFSFGIGSGGVCVGLLYKYDSYTAVGAFLPGPTWFFLI